MSYEKEALNRYQQKLSSMSDYEFVRHGMLTMIAPYNGQWVVRNHKTGEWVDDSRYSNDLKDKHGFR